MNDIDEIKKRVMIHPDATEFHIRRAPKKEIDIFKQFAQEQCLGDYGWAFSILVQEMIIKPQADMIHEEALANHEQRICSLEGKPITDIERVEWRERKMVDGTVKRWKVNKGNSTVEEKEDRIENG